jgi:glycosyltransferase involved in cell wall biosynthesis
VAVRILLHDFGRFSYPWQLARSLAERGHTVRYLYSTGEPARTGLEIPAGLESRLTVSGVAPARTLQKQKLVQRYLWEREYGEMLPPEISQFRPDVVISANAPLLAQKRVFAETRRIGAKFIFWVQDLLSIAAHAILSKKLSLPGALVGRQQMWAEGRLLRESDEIVLITEDFYPFMDGWKVPRNKTHVIENWAPIEQVPQFPRSNEWSDQHGLTGKRCIMYAGTIGMKHDPALLVRLARECQKRPDVRLVLAAEGSGVPMIRDAQKNEGLDNIVLLPFQSFETLPKALAAAEVLIALLEPEGSKYCVPSKVLTYLCSGRPIVLSVPEDNLIARIVEGNRAGVVVSPQAGDDFVKTTLDLLNDEPRRIEFGKNARAYAEATFRIDRITDRFEQLLN